MTESHRPAQPTGPPPRQGEPRRDVLREQAAWLQQQQPAYLIAALGRPGSRDWQMLALEIERYRRAAGVTSRACALGGVPGSPEEAGRWDRLADRIAAYQGVRTLTFDDLCVFPAQAAHRREHAALARLATVQRRLERQQAELRQQASRRLRWDSPLPAPAGDRTAQRL